MQIKRWTVPLAACVLLLATGCGQAASTPAADTTAASEPAASSVTMPVATQENGVITAEQWSEVYPEIYASYMENADNTIRVDYNVEDSFLPTLYEGTPFGKDYTSAVGHTYTLRDIAETTRPHALANCLTCKTPDYTALVNSLGSEAYSLDFEEVYAQMNEPISCYNCHENTPGTMVVTHSYLANAMGEDAGQVDPATLSCAQCHVEYYFSGENKEVTLPYTSLDTMNPDDILAFENEIGYVDYTNPRTGTEMIKVQHTEFETFMGEGSVHAANMNCASCHMGVTTNADGISYMDHNLTSPLDNPELIENTCSACHDDIAAEVKAIQDATNARTNEVAEQLVELTEKLAAAVESGDYTEEQLDEIRALNRDAMFYWDFVYVENSEGAHNSTLTNQCLDKAEQLTQQALALLQ